MNYLITGGAGFIGLNYLEKINNKYDIPKEFIVSYLFELVSNILNQEIFDYVYIFKKEDIDFVGKYNINVSDLIIYFRKNI